MSELWIYYRRPSSLVRYRHGGAAAFDPVMRSPLAKAVGHGGAGEPGDDHKILQFPLPPQAPRPQPSVKPRQRRMKPSKPKPKPKKRDS